MMGWEQLARSLSARSLGCLTKIGKCEGAAKNAKISESSAGPAMPTVAPLVSLSTVGTAAGTRLRSIPAVGPRGRRLQEYRRPRRRRRHRTKEKPYPMRGYFFFMACVERDT